MTAQGLRSLFETTFEIDSQEVPLSGVPIWTLAWMLRNWSASLPQSAKEDFLKMRVEELIGDPLTYLQRPFVRELPRENNFELASVTTIVGTRK